MDVAQGVGRMKIDTQIRADMAKVISPLDTSERRVRYLAGDFPRSDRTQDLDRRYRWDLLWESKYDAGLLYAIGCNDSHIDTALRAVVEPLKK